MRRCTHVSPILRQSSQPRALGLTSRISFRCLHLLISFSPPSKDVLNVRFPEWGYSLSDFGYSSLGGKLLELQGVMPGNNAINGPRQFDHASLILDVRGMIRIRKSRAGLVFGEVAVQIAVI